MGNALRPKSLKHQLAVKNGRAGGKAKAAKMRATIQGQERLRWSGLILFQRQLEVYGAVFANRVKRNPRGPKPKEQPI